MVGPPVFKSPPPGDTPDPPWVGVGRTSPPLGLKKQPAANTLTINGVALLPLGASAGTRTTLKAVPPPDPHPRGAFCPAARRSESQPTAISQPAIVVATEPSLTPGPGSARNALAGTIRRLTSEGLRVVEVAGPGPGPLGSD